MVGVPTDRAWRHDYRNAIKNPEFRIRTELEPENRFTRFALLWLNQGTYRRLQGTCVSGLTQDSNGTKKYRFPFLDWPENTENGKKGKLCVAYQIKAYGTLVHADTLKFQNSNNILKKKL